MFSREQEARDYLGSFGLGGKPSTLPLRMLSGGQKARAALALLLATRPHLLLLDGECQRGNKLQPFAVERHLL